MHAFDIDKAHTNLVYGDGGLCYIIEPQKKSGLLVNYKISLHFAVGYLCLTIYIYIYIEQRALYIHNLLGNCRRMFLVLFSFFLQPAEWTQLIGFASLLV